MGGEEEFASDGEAAYGDDEDCGGKCVGDFEEGDGGLFGACFLEAGKADGGIGGSGLM